MALVLPDLSTHTALVTGGNSGLGFETAQALAAAGARVLLACRNAEKAEAAIARIRAAHPAGRVEPVALDLASLASVRTAAQRVRTTCPRLDLLINNAGVMAVPYTRTADGFELQLGVNHLGHFALTGLLLESLLRADGARVVSVSSLVHYAGRLQLDDLQSERRYDKWAAYAQSKLANLLFAFELGRKLGRVGARAISVACHPGYASTQLQLVGPELERSVLKASLFRASNALFAQSAVAGAQSTLAAATASNAKNGDCYGPRLLYGAPARVATHPRARDEALASALWARSSELTGVRFEELES
jgi:NAD(P)-dependent dehydrogenase (short-subunit alcohol dehydrogenase family)